MKLMWGQEDIVEELCPLQQNSPTPCSHNINISSVFKNLEPNGKHFKDGNLLNCATPEMLHCYPPIYGRFSWGGIPLQNDYVPTNRQGRFMSRIYRQNQTPSCENAEASRSCPKWGEVHFFKGMPSLFKKLSKRDCYHSPKGFYRVGEYPYKKEASLTSCYLFSKDASPPPTSRIFRKVKNGGENYGDGVELPLSMCLHLRHLYHRGNSSLPFPRKLLKRIYDYISEAWFRLYAYFGRKILLYYPPPPEKEVLKTDESFNNGCLDSESLQTFRYPDDRNRMGVGG